MHTVHFQRIWPKSQLLGPHDGFKLQSSLLLHSEENWTKGLLKKEKKRNYLHKTTAKEKTIKERKSLFF